MQRYCTELTERLLKSLDKEYNVVDMGAVVDVITALEKTTITKEVLEVTRLGKYINELRRKTNNDALAKRAKDLVRRWRDMVLPSSNPTQQPTPADTAPHALNGTKPQSPALRALKPHSPAATRPLKPHSPLLRDSTSLKVLSPALHSERSRSPNTASTKQQQQQQQSSLSHVSPTATTASATNHRSSTELTSKLGVLSTHNHTLDAVPRTHSSNKRLRKDDSSGPNSPKTPPLTSSLTPSSYSRAQLSSVTNDARVSRFEPLTKRARLNGETANYDNYPKTTDTSNNNVLSLSLSSSSSRAPPSNSVINTGTTLNQKVPSPIEAEKANDRLSSDAITCKTGENKREALIADAPTLTSQIQAGPKKRGRKKGSKSMKNQSLPEDRVKEKLASISRNPKLKTTQELLADLQARGSSSSVNFPTIGATNASTGTTLTASTTTGATTTTAAATTTASGVGSRNNEPPSTEEILRNAAANDDRPLSARFQRVKRDKTNQYGDANRKNRDGKRNARKHWDNSKRSEEDEEDEDTEHDEQQQQQPYPDDIGRTRELTVEEILAKLPPLDRDAISWSDSEDVNDDRDDDDNHVVTDKKVEIRDEDVDRFHREPVEGLNGNYQLKIHGNIANEREIIDDETTKRISVYEKLASKENDREFREWHEMLARPSHEGQILHILPYVIID